MMLLISIVFVLFGTVASLDPSSITSVDGIIIPSNETTEPLNNRIVGGYEVDIEDFPYQVYIEYKGNTLYCGGFIVSDNYIITAAHCPHVAPETIVVRAGSSSNRNGTIIPIAKIISHPEYDRPKKYDKDIALLKTVDPIEFSDVIQPVKLPPKDRPMVAGSDVMISGWGRTQDLVPSSSPEHLRAAEIPVIDYDTCGMVASKLTPNQWCAGNFLFGGKGVCYGDSGSAAVQEDMAVGVTSYFHRGCGFALSPSVFVNIAAPTIRDFITENTGL